MIDIQSSVDTREIPLQKVGVRGLSYPVTVLDKAHKTQATTASIDLFVNLPHDYKGTHMSRFVEIFHKHHDSLGMKEYLAMLEEIRSSLNAEKAFGTMTFPFYMEKNAPVSASAGMMCYECTYEGEVSAAHTDSTSERSFYVSIAIPVSTVCPCSKAISERGAHNQRGVVKVRLQNKGFFWIEDVIAAVENAASCGLYSVLKRPDEKWVTEHAYDNPRFVEDVVREVSLALKNFPAEKPFSYFSVECETAESIHNHNAYAFTEFVGGVAGNSPQRG
ncbi:MAG: GTP cyclohydrolase I FolE2 [Treponema sp.]|nr:GTP cyclohydrolase I FolE2 [Treponema sp.]